MTPSLTLQTSLVLAKTRNINGKSRRCIETKPLEIEFAVLAIKTRTLTVDVNFPSTYPLMKTSADGKRKYSDRVSTKQIYKLTGHRKFKSFVAQITETRGITTQQRQKLAHRGGTVVLDVRSSGLVPLSDFEEKSGYWCLLCVFHRTMSKSKREVSGRVAI